MGDHSGGGVLKLVFDGVCSDKSEIPSHMIFQPENKAKINNFFFCHFHKLGPTYIGVFNLKMTDLIGFFFRNFL